MEMTRSASTIWHGDLATGSGEVSSLTSEHLRSLPVSWVARTEDPQGRTSPEELLAAAHAACFSMAFSSRLAKAGHPPERMEVRSDVTFSKGDDGWRVSRSALTVNARVPGVDSQTFQQAAESARDGCPISQALKGNVELSVEATLEAWLVPAIDQLQRVPEYHLDALLRQGIFTTGLLLEVSETPTRRQYLADQIGTTTNDVNAWRDEALLLNLANFGPGEQALFTHAGIVGLSDLLALDLEAFRARLGRASRILGVEPPGDLMTEGWWEQARTLREE